MTADLARPLYGATWGTAIRRFFGNYAIFRGRASPSEYWWWALTNVLVIIVLNALGAGTEGWTDRGLGLPLGALPSGLVTTVPGAIALVYGLGTLLPNFALTWRRLHDTDRSGAWFFLTLVPVIGWIVLFFFLIGSPRPEGARFD